MVDGSSCWRRLRPLGLLRSAARVGRDSGSMRELVGSLVGIFSDVGPLARSGLVSEGFLGGRGEGVGSELVQDVVAAAGELAGDGQRGARVGEPAGLEREVVGVVGAGGVGGGVGGVFEGPAPRPGALAGGPAGPGAAGRGG